MPTAGITIANTTEAALMSLGSEEPVVLSVDDVFEGPEKKLEVFFSRSPTVRAGFRSFDEKVWSELLIAAQCTIMHCEQSAAFDAYLLSESSLFVYPSRIILKTCGTTTLLLVLPRLLEMAAQIGATLEHAHYSRLRYKFPTMQVFPHTSFEVERSYLASCLEGHVAAVNSQTIGPPDGRCWYALCTEAANPLVERSLGESSLPKEVDDLFEVVMEGLSASVCERFYATHAAHGGVLGAALARSMTSVSGIGALLDGVKIDDWAFAPCGYSMNGSCGSYYYTIHITPELAFSYASFETNDPSYRSPERLAAVVSVFEPTSCMVTLTTRRDRCALPAYHLAALSRTSEQVVQLDSCGEVAVACVSFAAASVAAEATGEKCLGKELAMDVDATGSEASSEDICELSCAGA